MGNKKFDLFIFGSTSELMQHLISNYKTWFLEHVDRLIITQRTEHYPDIYQEFNPISITLDCSDTLGFRKGLSHIVEQYATKELPMHIFPTYGKFNWNYAAKNPVFNFSDDAYQINLVSRLQIIDTFKSYTNTKFHLFGSLFANFPYTGDYALSMWYINQLPKNSEYKDLDLIIYNLGGMKTRFWDYKNGPKNNPFLYDVIPTRQIFESGFIQDKKGIHTFYPSF